MVLFRFVSPRFVHDATFFDATLRGAKIRIIIKLEYTFNVFAFPYNKVTLTLKSNFSCSDGALSYIGSHIGAINGF